MGGNDDMEGIGTTTWCCFLAATDSVQICNVNSLTKTKWERQHSLEKLNFGGSSYSWESDDNKEGGSFLMSQTLLWDQEKGHCLKTHDTDGVEGFETEHSSKTGSNGNMEGCGTQCCLKMGDRWCGGLWNQDTVLVLCCHQFNSTSQSKSIYKTQANIVATIINTIWNKNLKFSWRVNIMILEVVPQYALYIADSPKKQKHKIFIWIMFNTTISFKLSNWFWFFKQYQEIFENSDRRRKKFKPPFCTMSKWPAFWWKFVSYSDELNNIHTIISDFKDMTALKLTTNGTRKAFIAEGKKSLDIVTLKKICFGLWWSHCLCWVFSALQITKSGRGSIIASSLYSKGLETWNSHIYFPMNNPPISNLFDWTRGVVMCWCSRIFVNEEDGWIFGYHLSCHTSWD